jgi:hypothetical protein
MKTPTIEQIQIIRSFANKVREARKTYEEMLAYVTPIQNEVLAKYPIYTDRETRAKKGKERILTMEKMYLSKDEATCQKIYDELHKRYADDGIELKGVGYCPALIAHSDLTEAEQAMIKAAEDITGITLAKVVCNLQIYRDYIELLLKL